ncbi:MAG: protein translocase subunit SecF [Candidatus Aenigmarchaeota archaeon]|nr:protein translocase subunit SecF [Candidatus Aenigmarchaeota archaeon]
MEMETKPKSKKLIIIPIMMLLVALILFYGMSSEGLKLDVDLAGGTQLVIDSERSINGDSLESTLNDFGASVTTSRGLSGNSIIIKYKSDVNTTKVLDVMKESGYSFDSYSIQTVGPSLGASFFTQAQTALLFAFIFMAIAIFVIFKKFMPSFYVVLCAFANLVEAVVISQFLGIELSLATFAALLLTLGYSVDTDILLTARVLKEKEGNVEDRFKGAFKTGITMTGTTLAALLVLYFATNSVVITQIASVLLIALVLDVINTWLLNANLLRWYMERSKK